MRTEKLRGSDAMEMQIRNVQWTVADWENWAHKNNVGLILEDGKVKGYETVPARYHA